MEKTCADLKRIIMQNDFDNYLLIIPAGKLSATLFPAGFVFIVERHEHNNSLIIWGKNG